MLDQLIDSLKNKNELSTPLSNHLVIMIMKFLSENEMGLNLISTDDK